MRTAFPVAAFALLFVAPPPLLAETLLVYPVQSTEGQEETSSALADIVAEQLRAAGHNEVLTYEDVRNVIDNQALQQLLGAEGDDAALVAASNKANADLIVRGSVTPLGGARVLSLTLIRTSDASVERKVTQTLYGNADQISASLRTASQALVSDLNPETRETVSAAAFHQVYLGEKPKSLNLRLVGGYRSALGGERDENGLFHLRAQQAVIDLEAGYLAEQHMELGIALSFGAGSSQSTLQGRLGLADDGTDPVSGAPRVVSSVSVLESTPDLSTTALFAGPYALFRPSHGTFLPFASVGIGGVFDRRNLKSAATSAYLPALGGTSCPDYASLDAELGSCRIDTELRPEKSANWRVGGGLRIKLGAELIVVENFAVQASATYLFSYFGSESEQVLVRGSESYDSDGTVSYVDVFALPAHEQSLSYNLGVLFYL